MQEITFKVTDGDILCQDISSDDELSIYYYNDEIIWNNMKKTLGYGESQQGDKAFESLVHNVVHEARELAPLSRQQLDDLIRKYDNNDMDQDNFIMACQEIDGILRNKMLPF